MSLVDAGLARRLAWLALALYLIGLCVSAVLRVQGDFNVYYLTGQRVLSGAPLYPPTDKNHFLYAPIFALSFAPFAMLPHRAAQGAWFLVSAFALLAALFGARRMLFARAEGFDAVLIVIPILFSARFINDNIQHGQINLQALALVIWAIVLAEEDQAPAAGAAMAAAILIKPFALLAALYLALRVRVRALVWTAVIGAILLALPILILGAQRAFGQTLAYAAAVHSMTGRYRLMLTNQSMTSAIARLLSGGSPLAPGADRFAFAAGATIELALIVAVSVWTIVRRNGDARESTRLPLCAMFCLMPGFAPVSWKSYFVTLLVPYMELGAVLLGDAGERGAPNRLAWTLTILSVVINILPGKHLNKLALFYSAHLLSSLLVLAALSTVSRRPAAAG